MFTTNGDYTYCVYIYSVPFIEYKIVTSFWTLIETFWINFSRSLLNLKTET